jgi:hypothetical protein
MGVCVRMLQWFHDAVCVRKRLHVMGVCGQVPVVVWLYMPNLWEPLHHNERWELQKISHWH